MKNQSSNNIHHGYEAARAEAATQDLAEAPSDGWDAPPAASRAGAPAPRGSAA
ncbi:hypothetical protein JMJ56_17695 [Belnapia sp. T18]|uniref:Uncharacterized protein n=1 Tax=Belnapia arida TaxID=2804533 RepID=A0ABS1U989_9PROT|nr:hypothetical protein [Belnapia arida]MBL6079856.1 hypothetical protein [Belnapia arida]